MSDSMIDPGFLLLLQDIDALTDGQIAPQEFERRFFANNELRVELPDRRYSSYDAYQHLFYAVEDYVADPALRTAPEDLGDDDLLSAAVTARAKFTQELAERGLDAFGRARTKSIGGSADWTEPSAG
jgi:hypothetical protein